MFRITGVISVIGGWFLTAGAAFIGAGLIVAAMHYGGQWVMLLLAALTIFIIINSNRRFRKKTQEDNGDALFQTIISTQDKTQTWPLLMMYITEQQEKFMTYAEEKYRDITSACSIFGWQRKEIVVDMLFADLVDAAQVVKYAHTAVVAEIEPSAFFYRHLACQMTQT